MILTREIKQYMLWRQTQAILQQRLGLEVVA